MHLEAQGPWETGKFKASKREIVLCMCANELKKGDPLYPTMGIRAMSLLPLIMAQHLGLLADI